MTERTPVYCETAELVVEASAVAQRLSLKIEPQLSADPLDAAAHASVRHGLACAICLRMPDPEHLVASLDIRSSGGRLVLAALSDQDAPVRGLAADLGLVCVADVAPALAAVALLVAGSDGTVRAHGKKLSSADRARLSHALSERTGLRVVSLGPEHVGAELSQDSEAVTLGGAHAVATALVALRASQAVDEPPVRVETPELAQAREVLFGPPRLLSDPASKAALGPFGLPMPQEELCTSPSRASAEAARIGFPVRITLASPDLRVWDHPDLSVDGVDNAARVRDVYRQLLSAAEERAPDARVLGVRVTATTLARALVRMTARPLPHGRVLLRIGFADPHGAVAKDAVLTALPAGELALARALSRLRAHALLLGDSHQERERNLHVLSDVCARIASFVDAFRREVLRVELNPVALLVGEGAEIREAAIEVTDVFVRELG